MSLLAKSKKSPSQIPKSPRHVQYNKKSNLSPDMDSSSDSSITPLPHIIFQMLSDLKFPMGCDYSISKLPAKLSKFYQQSLLSWKLCYIHNFSLLKVIIWYNTNITVNRKSLYKENKVERTLSMSHPRLMIKVIC